MTPNLLEPGLGWILVLRRVLGSCPRGTFASYFPEPAITSIKR